MLFLSVFVLYYLLLLLRRNLILSLFITTTECVARATRRVPLVEQGLLILPETPLAFSGVC